MNKILACLAGAIVLHAGVAIAAGPAAPQVTTGADIKLLRFDWNYVPRANYYELWFQANAQAAWSKFGQTPSSAPRTTNNVSAHLLDWQNAHYQVKACNPSGCTGTAPIAVDDLRFDAVGYFKGSTTFAGANFGDAVALSEDGSTLAVVATKEPSPRFGDTAGFVYVFHKSSAGWKFEARLVPDPQEPLGHFASVSLSANGNVLALGLPYSLQVAPGPGTSGGVFLFRRSGSTWAQDGLVQRELDERADDQFGYIAKLDEAGDTLLVGRGGAEGISTIYSHTTAGWTHVIDIPHEDEWLCGRQFGSITLSGDGKSLIRVCKAHIGPTHSVRRFVAPTWSGSDPLYYGYSGEQNLSEVVTNVDGTFIVFATRPVQTTGDVRRFVWTTRVDNGVPMRQDVIRGPENQDPSSATRWGEHIALSRDAQYIAVTDAADSGAGYGVQDPPLLSGTRSNGAVYVYERRKFVVPNPYADFYYGLRRVLKPNVAGSTTAVLGDGPLSFGQNGKILASGSISDSSAATGVDGSRTNASKPGAGAVWLY